MVRGIVVFGGSSHPQLTAVICNALGIPAGDVFLGKFAVGETRVEIKESVRGKDVYIIQSGGGSANDHLMELLVTVAACKTASARKVTAVLPLFPYSRQSDLPYNKVGAPLARAPLKVDGVSTPTSGAKYSFESRPESPRAGHHEGSNYFGGGESLQKQIARSSTQEAGLPNGTNHQHSGSNSSDAHYSHNRPQRSDTVNSTNSSGSARPTHLSLVSNPDPDNLASAPHTARTPAFEPQRGYRQWVAQAGTLVADLLTCAGTDHVITMDLHDPQYQGFFDIPVDNLYGRHLLRKYIERQIPNYKDAVIVSPDAGGAKRATAIADSLGMPFALIHKERRPAQTDSRQNASLILVGSVANRTAILIDDLADTSNTITRAARLLQKSGATTIYALVTHGVLSGDAIDRINHSPLDRLVVTNSVDQRDHCARCPKLEVLEVGEVFAEAIRRVHHGESISVLFQHD